MEIAICRSCNRKKPIQNRTHWLCAECNVQRKEAHKAFLGLPVVGSVPVPYGTPKSTSSFAKSPKKRVKHDSEIYRDEIIARDRFYTAVWDGNEEKKCYECGGKIPFFSRSFIHHIIEKHFDKYYSCSLHQPDNGILLCLECHSKVHTNIDFAPKVKQLTEQKKLEYEPYFSKK